MIDYFLLKVITESNKKFILNISQTCSINILIKTIKDYYATYFKKQYLIEFILSSDKFIILNDLNISKYFTNGDICYVQGRESGKAEDTGEISNKVKYDVIRYKKDDTKIFPDFSTEKKSKCIRNFNIKNMSPNKITEKSKKDSINLNLVKDNTNIQNTKNGPKILSSSFYKTISEKDSVVGYEDRVAVDKDINLSADASHTIKSNTETVSTNIKRLNKPESSDLFNTEKINKHKDHVEVVDVKRFKQIKKKQKVNYEDL